MAEYVEIFTKEFLYTLIPNKEPLPLLNDIIINTLNNIIYVNITQPATDRVFQKVSPLSEEFTKNYISNPLAEYIASKLYWAGYTAYVASYREDIRKLAETALDIKK